MKKIYDNLNEREWLKRFSDQFFDDYSYHEIKTFNKKMTDTISLYNEAYKNASLIFEKNKNRMPELMASDAVITIINKTKEIKNV